MFDTLPSVIIDNYDKCFNHWHQYKMEIYNNKWISVLRLVWVTHSNGKSSSLITNVIDGTIIVKIAMIFVYNY